MERSGVLVMACLVWKLLKGPVVSLWVWSIRINCYKWESSSILWLGKQEALPLFWEVFFISSLQQAGFSVSLPKWSKIATATSFSVYMSSIQEHRQIEQESLISKSRFLGKATLCSNLRHMHTLDAIDCGRADLPHPGSQTGLQYWWWEQGSF